MALIQVSKAQAASGERAEALGTLKEARALAASLPTDSAASAISRWTLLARVAETQADGGDIEAARGTFEDIRKPIGAVEDLGRDDNQHALDHVRVGIARAQARAGRFAEADLELRQIGDGLRKADGLALIAEAKSASGDWEGAGKAVDAIEFAETKVKALGELAKKRAKAGDPGAARRLLDNALQAAERAERDDGRAAARRWVALARAEVDGVAAGLAAAGAIPALPEDNFPFRQRALSELRARAGDYAGARASAREIPERYQGGRQRALVLRLVSQIEADAGDIAGALATVAEIKLPVARAGALIDVAAARAQAGDRAGGAESFREALRLLQATADAPEPLFDDRPPTYRELARAQAAAGDAAAAEAWIDALDSPELRAWCLTGLVEGAAKAKLPGGAGPREGRGAVDPIPNSRQWAVRVGPNVQVSRARPDLPHEEVFIVADTGDPRRLAAASMTRPAHEVAAKTILYASTDGGASWETTLECRGPDPQGSFDPAFAAGPDGTLVYVQVVSPKSDDAEHREDRLECRASRDGGATWGTATVVRRFFDRPFLTFDRSAGKHRGRLYCTNVNGILVSDDRGATFAKLRPWDRARRMLGYGRGNPAVLSDGRLLVSYAPYTLAHTKYVAVQASTDGGDSFTEERRVAGEFAYHVPNSLPAMAVVPGPGDKDRVLLAWTEPQADGRPCIRLATSEDRGASFSRTEVLSEQPDPGVDRAAQRKRGYESIMPTLAVDRRGVVGLSWYDTRDLPEEGQGWDVRFRASPDGGRTWLPSVRVTEVSTLLAGDDRGRRARVHRGDTAGLDAGSDGRFHCLWVDGRTGLGQAWTASLEVTSGK